MNRTRLLIPSLLATLLLLLGLVAAGCGGDDDDKAAAGDQNLITANAANAGTTLTIGSKNFTEQKVLGEIYAQALKAAGYTVETELNLGDEKTALKALKDGQISAYPEYTGTALVSFFNVKSDALPKDSEDAFEDVKENFAKQGIDALPPTPFTSSNEVAVTKETADRLDLEEISDLEDKAGELTLYGSPECRQRLDCLLGLEQVYELKFKKFVPVDIALRHEVLDKKADVSIVFTTDPQNKRDELVLLEDDKEMFPPYNSTFLVKQSTVEQAGPDLQKTIELVNKGLTAEAMQELNARVDLDKQTPAAVARQYLKESGYIE